jgi:hypothetical protein
MQAYGFGYVYATRALTPPGGISEARSHNLLSTTQKIPILRGMECASAFIRLGISGTTNPIGKSPMRATEDRIQTLLCEELNAAEVYKRAVETLCSDSRAYELNRICQEHREAANVISQYMKQQKDLDCSEMFEIANTATGADLFCVPAARDSALETLRANEEKGIEFYEEALNDEGLSIEFRTIIRSTLLMQSQEHVRILDRLLTT